MAHAIKENTTLILLESGTASKGQLRRWLTNSGFVTWEASDICHAIEEMSDYTVRCRPDVVLLEVATMPDSIDTFRSTLQMSADCHELSVLGYSPRKSSKDLVPFVASDLNQLSSFMNKGRASVALAS